MIDWVSATLPCDNDGNICNGVVAQVNREGDTEWLTMTYLPVVGSHDATIAIRSVTESTIEISGNPAKWLQGHNLFGINDPVKLISLTIKQLLINNLGLKPTKTQLEDINNVFVKITKIDINRNFHLPSKTEE